FGGRKPALEREVDDDALRLGDALPASHKLAVEKRDVRYAPVATDDGPRVTNALADGATFLVADEVFVVVGEQHRGHGRATNRSVDEPVIDSVERGSRQLLVGHLNASRRVADGEARPPREVVERRRTARREVAKDEREQRFVALELGRRWNT